MRAVVGKHVGLWFLLLLASHSLPPRDEPVIALPCLKYSKWRFKYRRNLQKEFMPVARPHFTSVAAENHWLRREAKRAQRPQPGILHSTWSLCERGNGEKMTMGAVGSVSSCRAGWEWRFFVPVPLDEGELPLAGQREDIYFPAGDGLGLKLRNGSSQSLEVKKRLNQSPEGAEQWSKSLHRGCLNADGLLDVTRCAEQIGIAPEEFAARGLPVVRVRKKRRWTELGEEVDCLFMVEGDQGLIAERYTSVSVEATDLQDVLRVTRQLQLPDNATMAGYPQIVQRLAERAGSPG
ncbi:unnamed protein product [Cladocopium goreaui]|uniref:Dehydrogenase/reductase SDR family member 13 n=1 Tax=Cladocopium goreaui TaxID=2562237 RepID=A0A9P1FT51_9DINO|nr:unnamed protein product [Cladocopium goreaui]